MFRDVILQNVIARPLKDNAGVEDLLSWECAIPGPPKVRKCYYTVWNLCILINTSFAFWYVKIENGSVVGL